MTTHYDTDPNTQTFAAAWASSELGQPENEVRWGFADDGEPPLADDTALASAYDTEPTADQRGTTSKHAVVAAAVGLAVSAAAAVGLMFFSFGPEPTVAVPGPVSSPITETAAPAPADDTAAPAARPGTGGASVASRPAPERPAAQQQPAASAPAGPASGSPASPQDQAPPQDGPQQQVPPQEPPADEPAEPAEPSDPSDPSDPVDPSDPGPVNPWVPKDLGKLANPPAPIPPDPGPPSLPGDISAPSVSPPDPPVFIPPLVVGS